MLLPEDIHGCRLCVLSPGEGLSFCSLHQQKPKLSLGQDSCALYSSQWATAHLPLEDVRSLRQGLASPGLTGWLKRELGNVAEAESHAAWATTALSAVSILGSMTCASAPPPKPSFFHLAWWPELGP